MGVWGHLRLVDHLCSRPDVDADYVFSMGSSGGGYMTRFLFADHEQAADGIISSSPTGVDHLAGFQFRSIREWLLSYWSGVLERQLDG